jgi:Fic family protein
MFVAQAPSVSEMIEKLDPGAMGRVIESQGGLPADDDYTHWDKLRHLTPPDGLSSDEWWLGIKIRRTAGLRFLPLSTADGAPFAYGLPDVVLRHLHRIDQRCSGEVAMDEVVTSEQQASDRFLVNSLMEEAIRSSQLEGATTTRKVAKEMLRTGRKPRNRSERMILNNYQALQFMREEMGDALTTESVLELHRIVTEGTLDDPDAAGRLQRPGEERVAVYYRDEDDLPIHSPPPAEQLPERLERLCAFANEDDGGEQFVHPVLRAILLHFWLAYDHPFEDGNGRTARILFFWAMQKRGYWLIEYLPISPILRRAPAKYTRAFMESETDGGDTTYFLIHQLKTIERALDEHEVYMKRKIAEVRDLERLLHSEDGLNHRQLALLTDAVRTPHNAYSFSSHAMSHRVTHETARADLSALVERGLLTRRRKGHRYVFEPVPDLPSRLKESPA